MGENQAHLPGFCILTRSLHSLSRSRGQVDAPDLTERK
jgi:hypothetical protein